MEEEEGGGKGSVVANRGKRGNCRTLAANEVGEGRGRGIRISQNPMWG